MDKGGKLIENLKIFNSKERFYLVGQILGNPEFTPDPVFLMELFGKLKLQVSRIKFSAMDYHLDWLYASLALSMQKDMNGTFTNSEDDKKIYAQQEDLDFMLVFENEEGCHIVLIEAKGVTGWSNTQMESKAKRLEEIFGKDGKDWEGVTPHFIMISPQPTTKKLKETAWPAWMKSDGKIIWMKLEIPKGLKRVARCDEKGDEDKNGKRWKVFPR